MILIPIPLALPVWSTVLPLAIVVKEQAVSSFFHSKSIPFIIFELSLEYCALRLDFSCVEAKDVIHKP